MEYRSKLVSSTGQCHEEKGGRGRRRDCKRFKHIYTKSLETQLKVCADWNPDTKKCTIRKILIYKLGIAVSFVGCSDDNVIM